MVKNVIKRSGKTVEFKPEKIKNAISNVFEETDNKITESQLDRVTSYVVEKIEEEDTVESIQDKVETTLLDCGYIEEARKYIHYREKHNRQRKQWVNDGLPLSIWKRKYQFKNETFEEFFDRVSGGNEKIRKIIKNKEFLPAGRILANRGLQEHGLKVTYSNCYVATPPEDNLESIVQRAGDLARTYSYGGGEGIDISKLRPQGSKVHNAAKTTSGAPSFMGLYDEISSIIGMKGRRAALMISLDVSHPDVEQFIEKKLDLDSITKANISIKVTDDFMEAVKNDEKYTLSFHVKDTGEDIEREVNASKIFNKLAYGNWFSSEPGTLFWDKIKNYSILQHYDDFEFAGTNPCFTGDTKLLTDKGYKELKSLSGKDKINIINKDGEITKGKVWSNGIKDIVKLNFYGKESVKCTPDHIFMTNKEENIKAVNLKGKRIMPFIKTDNKKYSNLFIKLGFIQGDGNLGRLASQTHKGVGVNLGENDQDVKKLFNVEENGLNSDKRTYYTSEFTDILNKLEFSSKKLPERNLPSTFDTWTEKEQYSFLRGLFSANGSVLGKSGRGRVTLKSTSINLIKSIYDFLTERGFEPYITTNKVHKNKFNNGEYLCKESYDLNIGKYKNKIKFLEEIGFVQEYKRDKLKKYLIKYSPKVSSIEKLGKKEVFDFNEPKTHWGVIEGLVAHNCGEEPLPSGGSCLLGAINLAKFVNDEFENNVKFNYDKFKKVIKESVVALNEILDEGLELHPLKEQRDSVRNWRQIGLGIMGLSDMLIKLKIRYGSEEALRLLNKIGRVFANEGLKQSALLAKQQGTFPKYDKESTLKSSYLKEVADKDTLDLIEKHGLRNSQLFTVAPTGSISNLCEVSGGIEPIFKTSYIRKTESLHNEEKEYKVFTPIIEKVMENENIEDENNLPNYVTDAHKLNYIERIKMQSIWQKYTDASISSTVNLDNEATVEDIKDLYMKAWEYGLKGITVYRDGCARGAILRGEEETGSKTEMTEQDWIDMGICPDCKSDLSHVAGCEECTNCGWGKCAI